VKFVSFLCVEGEPFILRNSMIVIDRNLEKIASACNMNKVKRIVGGNFDHHGQPTDGLLYYFFFFS